MATYRKRGKTYQVDCCVDGRRYRYQVSNRKIAVNDVRAINRRIAKKKDEKNFLKILDTISSQD